VQKLSAANCKAFTGLCNCAQMVGGGRALKRKFVRKVSHPLARQRHHRFGNHTYAEFISQWWQCSTALHSRGLWQI